MRRGRFARLRRAWGQVAVWLVRMLAAAGVLALVGGLVLVLWRGPWWFDGKYLKGADFRSGAGALVTGFRTTVVQVLVGIAAIVALWYTARNYRLARRGQVTDRFIKALELLGSEEMYVRMGGVLALEQIVQDAPDQALHAGQVLEAFIRRRVLQEARPHQPSPKARPDPDRAAAEPAAPAAPADRPPLLPKQPEDIQAALTALTRPASRRRLGHDHRIDLSDLPLKGADLSGADLSGVDLCGADLRAAWFHEADLTGAKLLDANLMGAWLYEADLTGAWCYHANLDGAMLAGADLFTANALSGEQVAAACLTLSTRLPPDIAAHPDVVARIAEAERSRRRNRRPPAGRPAHRATTQ